APVLDMPTDYPRPQVQSYRGSSESFRLTAEETKELEALCKKTGATEYMVFLSALMITLSKYSRQEDIVIGSPISGRTHRDTENMLGMFVNTLAMRGRPEGKKTVGEFLAEVKDLCLKAYENQEYPFEELAEKVEVRRDISRNPLFDVMLVLQNNEDVPLKLKGLKITGGLSNSEVSKFDLEFNISKEQETYSIQTGYCTDLFKAETVQWLNKHYREALRRMTENPEVKLENLSLTDAAEYEKLVHTFNDTAADYPKDKTVIELFEEQVERTPENVAVVFEDTQLSYRELNKKSNQFARYLQSFGVQKGDTVALLSERTTDFVVGITGVLKAGAVYLPIDSNYPEHRIRLLLEDSGAKALILGGNKAIDQIDIPQLRVSDAEGTMLSASEIHVEKTARDLAYIIYTSGTTGRPKGAMIEDISIIRLVKENNYLKLDEHTRILQTGSMAFDAATLEVWGALLNGGRLYLTGEETLLKPEELEEEINRNGITTMWMTSTLFNQMINLREGVFDRLEDL
ncbi:MAG: AMP-binding protein, partial [Ruminococcus sp.]|nr:AMP-binding protein [Ruminococcus sp.]